MIESEYLSFRNHDQTEGESDITVLGCSDGEAKIALRWRSGWMKLSSDGRCAIVKLTLSARGVKTFDLRSSTICRWVAICSERRLLLVHDMQWLLPIMYLMG